MTNIKHYRMLIDGAWVGASDGKTFESVNPSTGQVWALIPEATAEDVDRAVRAADRAFSVGPWPEMTPTQRGQCLRRLGDLLAERSEDLGTVETIDTGKMLKETRWQAKYIAEFFHFFAGCADKIHGETLPIDKSDMMVFTLREPLGVVAAIVPWNAQLFLSAVKIAPALAAGNTVVLKLSEHASGAMLEFGELIAAAGIPPGVVNIVTGEGDTGAAIGRTIASGSARPSAPPWWSSSAGGCCFSARYASTSTTSTGSGPGSSSRPWPLPGPTCAPSTPRSPGSVRRSR